MHSRRSEFAEFTLGTTRTLANTKAVTIAPLGELTIQCQIDGVTTLGQMPPAATGSAPSDTPVGVFQLWVQVGPYSDYALLTSSAITAELAKLAPNGNNLVNGLSIFKGIGGTNAKILYIATSGGAASRCRLTFSS